MLLPIIETKTRLEEATGRNSMKLGMNKLYRNTNNIIEALFDIPPPSRDMGPLRTIPGGARIVFSNFSNFLYSRALPMDHSFTQKHFFAAKAELFVCWREGKGFETCEFLSWMGNVCICTRYGTLKTS